MHSLGGLRDASDRSQCCLWFLRRRRSRSALPYLLSRVISTLTPTSLSCLALQVVVKYYTLLALLCLVRFSWGIVLHLKQFYNSKFCCRWNTNRSSGVFYHDLVSSSGYYYGVPHFRFSKQFVKISSHLFRFRSLN